MAGRCRRCAPRCFFCQLLIIEIDADRGRPVSQSRESARRLSERGCSCMARALECEANTGRVARASTCSMPRSLKWDTSIATPRRAHFVDDIAPDRAKALVAATHRPRPQARYFSFHVKRHCTHARGDTARVRSPCCRLPLPRLQRRARFAIVPPSG